MPYEITFPQLQLVEYRTPHNRILAEIKKMIEVTNTRFKPIVVHVEKQESSDGSDFTIATRSFHRTELGPYACEYSDQTSTIKDIPSWEVDEFFGNGIASMMFKFKEQSFDATLNLNIFEQYRD